MRTRSFLASSVAVLGMATAVTPARAQDAQTQATGRALFNEGVALFNKGDFEAACPKLEASLKQYAGLGTRGKLAECYEKQGRLASAWQAYRDVAQLAARSGDPTREQVAAERAKSLEPKISYVTLVLPPSHEVSGLVVKRGGREIERAKLGSAEPVDSGNITVEASAPGRKPFKGQVTAMQGQAVRFEIPLLALEATAAAALALSSGPTAKESKATATPPSPLAPPSDYAPSLRGDPPSWQRPVGVVLIVAGIAGVGVGGAFGLSARSKYDDSFEAGGGCDRATLACNASGQRNVDDARSQALLSTILFGAGGALAVTGIIVYLTAPSARPRALHLAPTSYAGGGGLVLGGTL